MVMALLAAAVALVIGSVGSVYLLKIARPREEARAGIAALPELRWREFVALLTLALSRLGYERRIDPNAGGDENELKMLRDGQLWLVSAKHGASYVLGPQAIREFARAIEMHGAAGGLLVTPGHFSKEALPEASFNHIELYDGQRLWPELAPALDRAQYQQFIAPARQRIRTQLIGVWVVALVAGLGAWLLLGSRAEPVAPGQPPATPSVVAAPAGQSGAVPSPTPAGSATATPAATPAESTDTTDARATIPTEPAELARRRGQVADAVRTLPGVEKANWSGESTLVVLQSGNDIDARGTICPLLQPYPELRATRLQLQPPRESGRLVSYFQCWMY